MYTQQHLALMSLIPAWGYWSCETLLVVSTSKVAHMPQLKLTERCYCDHAAGDSAGTSHSHLLAIQCHGCHDLACLLQFAS